MNGLIDCKTCPVRENCRLSYYDDPLEQERGCPFYRLLHQAGLYMAKD
jgi:hypothetical protein